MEVQSFSTVERVAYNLRGNETILLTRGSIDGYVESKKNGSKFTQATLTFGLSLGIARLGIQASFIFGISRGLPEPSPDVPAVDTFTTRRRGES